MRDPLMLRNIKTIYRFTLCQSRLNYFNWFLFKFYFIFSEFKYFICFMCILLFSGLNIVLLSLGCIMDFQLALGPIIVLHWHATLSNLLLPVHLIYLLFILCSTSLIIMTNKMQPTLIPVAPRREAFWLNKLLFII